LPVLVLQLVLLLQMLLVLVLVSVELLTDTVSQARDRRHASA